MPFLLLRKFRMSILLFFSLSSFAFSIWKKEKTEDEQYPPMSETPTIPFGYYKYSTYFYSQTFESTSPFAPSQDFAQGNNKGESNFEQSQEFIIPTVPPQITPTIPPMKDDEL